MKTMLAFFGGVLVTLAVVGLYGKMDRSEIPMTMEGVSKMDMEGMPMEGMQSQGIRSQGMDQANVMVATARRQLMGVKTGLVQKKPLETVVRTVGTVDYDERRIRQIHLRVSGWITNLLVDYTGKFVQAGDPLFTLYSPDLVSTQEEYLLAKRMLDPLQSSPVMHVRTGAEAQVDSARNRLLLWGLTKEQIAKLEEVGNPPRETPIYSPINGVVTEKMALQGMYVTPEMNLYTIADLARVWIYADLYEYELSLIQRGQEATLTLASYPGEAFHGQVIYIYPYLNKETRTVKIRMEVPNLDGRLKPGMYGNVEIRVKGEERLAIPQEAVLDSGTRKLVFVDKGDGLYEPREVQLGNKINQLYPVLSGLSPDERVVTSATFLIDSESKLMAAANMMGMLGMGGIKMEQAQMGEMEMPGMSSMAGMQMDASAGGPMAREQTVEGLTLHFSTMPDPPKKGKNMIHLEIKSKKGPVTNAKVAFAYTMAMPGMGIETVEAEQTREGMYMSTVEFGMQGAWEIEATVVRGKNKPVKAKFTVSVKK